ncbi:SusC/RagA family TonB-linked outer membrane protein [Pedobacter aquatilis]|uniref:SusC/RagA family TonB-linked outer membrane protein n=1 Tax=Pedobacter aquatilis TaxID=351343 RepID=UPI00292E08BA|nr:SusC/RagA family TonB-linked outer membrane protein [Pedobacter aquatilis]
MKKMYLKCLSALLLTLLTTVAFAQKTITGTVLDGSEPIPGVSVTVKGTTKATQTDNNGKFSISANVGNTLVFSYLGYTSKEVAVSSSNNISVSLTAANNDLNEVVVTALGIKRERKSLGYAVQEVKGETLVEAREPNLANALTGKVAGLQVTRSSNGPGGSSKIVLRGYNSLTGNNQPLLVVDGVPVENFTGANNNDFWNPSLDMGNGISDINAQDIESISVLKGGAAAALYGSRAGNGVILINTKSGRTQKGLGISVNSTTGIENIFMNPDMQNDFGQGLNGIYDERSNLSWGPKIGGQTVKNWDGRQVPLTAYDNIDNFFRTGVSLNNSVAFQQQYKNTSVYTSFNRMDDKSMIPGVKLTRTNLMAKANTKFGKDDRWMVDTKIQYSNSDAVNRPVSGTRGENTFWTIYNLPRSLDVTQFSAATDQYRKMLWYGGGNQRNPYWNNMYNTNNDVRDRYILNGAIKYNFTDWLNAEVRAGADMYSVTTENKTFSGSPAPTNGSYGTGKQNFKETNYSAMLNARKDNLFGKFGGAAMLGTNLMARDFSSLSGGVGELNVPDFFSLNNGMSAAVVDQGFSKKRINSVFGSAQLSYDDYLFLDATFRNDWTSTLSKENRSFFYPSVSLSYVITDMITKNGSTLPSWLSYAKLRGSYAEVGNDMEPYQLFNTYTLGKDPNGNTTAGKNGVLYNPDVRNEFIKSFELGTEIRFFKSRFGLDVTYYKSNATNQLINLPLDPLSGYNSMKINAGDLQNQGFEITADARILNNPNKFNWNLSVNYSRNINTVEDIYNSITQYNLGGYDDVSVRAVTGERYGEIYGSRYQRVNNPSSPFNGQIIVDANGIPLKDSNPVKLGNQGATGLLGITNTFAYKSLSLSFQVDARFGGQIFSASNALMQANGTAAVTVVNGERANIVADGVYLNPATNAYEKNTKGISPQLYWQAVAANGNIGITEANLYDASNIRLRTVNLSYDLPVKFLSKTPIQRAKIGVSVNNAWMIKSHMNGIDPESVFATGSNAVGFENSSPPTTRSYFFNLSLGF